MLITSGPCSPSGWQGLEGICLEGLSQPPALANQQIGRDNTKQESVPKSQTICLCNTFQGTLGYTLGHMFIQTQVLNSASCLWIIQGPHPLPLHCDGKYLLALLFFFPSLTSCFYSVAWASCFVYFRLL